MGSAVVEARDLWVSYGDLNVVKGISFSVEKGERTVIMGPSGSGKSTLLRSLIWLVKPKRGFVRIAELDVTERTVREVRKKVGFVFQHYNLFPHLTVLRNITLPLEITHGLSKEEAEKKAIDVLKLVGLEDKASSYPLQLSGGQQQRVAIARALAIDPVVLMLDEPTSALDPELVEEVLETLRNIARRGVTMIIVTHEIDFALDVADRMMFIEDGRVVEEGPPDELVYNPKSERTRRFLRRILRRSGEGTTKRF